MSADDAEEGLQEQLQERLRVVLVLGEGGQVSLVSPRATAESVA